jgi:hypothetical protein
MCHWIVKAAGYCHIPLLTFALNQVNSRRAFSAPITG